MRLAAILACVLAWPASAGASEFKLSSDCPASFQALADGTCELVTLYEFYDSPPGHGGLQGKLVPPKERFTPQEIDLGRYLFFDPVLSAGQTTSCSSCHDPTEGFQDGRKRAVGTRELDRKTPSLWNVAFDDKFMWDGRAHSLEEQALLPLTNPDEMGNTPERLAASLSAIPAYVALFHDAFGRAPDVAAVTRSLAAFESSLISLNSRYDRYAHGDLTALTESEIRGHNLFRGFVARCSQCHVPPLFTDNEFAVIGAPPDDRGYFDAGAGPLTADADMIGALKVPSLRNVALIGPYFSGGQFSSLHDVVDFYNDTRGHAAPRASHLKIHWHIHMTHGPELSEQDVDDIVAFLGALTDQTMMPAIPTRLPSGLPLPALHGPVPNQGDQTQ